MRAAWIFGTAALVAASASLARAQVTRTATFENFPSNTFRGHTFTDPLSGTTFRDATSGPGNVFSTNHSDTYFGPGNYLDAFGAGEGALGSFGFTGDLAGPADRIGLDVLYAGGPRSDVTLRAFNAAGDLLAQQSGPAGFSFVPFDLQVDSAQYDITTFRLTVGAGPVAYDNISYTVLPEPNTAFAISTIALSTAATRRRPHRRP